MSNIPGGTTISYVVQYLGASWVDLVQDSTYVFLEEALQEMSGMATANPTSKYRVIQRTVVTYTNTSEKIVEDWTEWLIQFRLPQGVWTMSPDVVTGLGRQQADDYLAKRATKALRGGSATEYRKVQIIVPDGSL